MKESNLKVDRQTVAGVGNGTVNDLMPYRKISTWVSFHEPYLPYCTSIVQLLHGCKQSIDTKIDCLSACTALYAD